MRKRAMIAAVLALAGAGAVAQGLPPFPQEDVLIIVWSGADRCTVLDRKTNCSRVASMLTGRFQVGRERNIVVATETNGQELSIRASQLMTDLRAAGYRRVRAANVPAGMSR